jgi:hypothetical protein
MATPHFTEAQVALAGLIIQVLVGVFGSGVFYATVKFLRKEVKAQGERLSKVEDKTTEHGEIIEGLKVRTHYAGR